MRTFPGAIFLATAFLFSNAVATVQDSLYNEATDSSQSPWLFHFHAENKTYFLNESKEYGDGEVSGNALGNEISGGIAIDYDTDNFTHTLSVGFAADFLLVNDPDIIDTNSRLLSPEIGYSFSGESFALDFSASLEIPDEEDMSYSLFAMFYKRFTPKGTHTFNLSTWAFSQELENLVAEAVFTYKFTPVKSLALSLGAGPKFESDSTIDYDALLSQKKKETGVPLYWGKWLGPSVKAQISYRILEQLTATAKARTFYGFAIDWPTSDGLGMQKESSSLGLELSWRAKPLTFLLGLERRHVQYRDMSTYFALSMPEIRDYTTVKASVKAEW